MRSKFKNLLIVVGVTMLAVLYMAKDEIAREVAPLTPATPEQTNLVRSRDQARSTPIATIVA